jgi:uncharacterized membrane protein YraQ (UPF0718 family)
MSFLRQYRYSLLLVVGFLLFVGVSWATGFAPGRTMGGHFGAFLRDMMRVLPAVFILIGLFDVWVKRETVEKHLGHGAGLVSYLWALLLAATAVGGLHVAFPIAYALHAKGARLGVVLAYLAGAAICRVPMTLFEASFLGWRFTIVRFAVSLPLVVATSALLGAWFERRGYRLPVIEAAPAGR